MQQNQSHNLLLSGHQGQILSVLYNNSSQLLASGSTDKTIMIWSTKSYYQNISVLKSHNNAVTSLAWTYTDRLLSASADKSICNWDVEMQKLIRKYKGHHNIIHDVCTPKKTLDIIGSVGDDGFLHIWQQRSRKQIKTLQYKYPLTSCCFNLNGNKIFIGGIDNNILCYNIAEQKIQEIITAHQDTISCLSLSYDGNYLMSNSFDQTIRIWNIKNHINTNKRLTKTLTGHLQGNQKTLLRSCWSIDGLYISCGSIDRYLYIWDTTTKKIIQKLGGHYGTINQVTMGQNNSIASGSNDKNIIVSLLPEIFL